MKTTITYLAVLLYLFPFPSVFSQSISGNVKTCKNKSYLGYANVNIYKNGKLVANVLTDETGNYNVKLDTGMYDCEIVYAGYEKTVKKIEVKSDEKADFSMSGDAKSKYSAEKVSDLKSSSLNRYRAPLPGIVAGSMWGISAVKAPAVSGKLTAGEINDFSKWKMWSDLSGNELQSNRQYWKFEPSGRYVVQVTSTEGLPLVNAKAELMEGNVVIFTSLSDNTGKAELWKSLVPDTLDKKQDMTLRVTYQGETKTRKNARTAEKGINGFEFTSVCNQPQEVDIAIVVDATGSMQDEIDYLKSDLNDVIYRAKEISNTLHFRFANIFYRDKGDEYIVKSQDFTGVLSESVAFTAENNAAGGGDEPESADIALDSAINGLKWREGSRTRIIFLVLDAPPHNSSETAAKIRALCMQAAAKGIRIVPVTGSGTSKNAEYILRCLALATNGTYTFLTNHSAIGNNHTEPSTDHYQVEVLNDLLIRIIKSYTYMPDCQQYITDMGIHLPDSQVVFVNPEDTAGSHLPGTEPAERTEPGDSISLCWSFYPNPTDGIIQIVSNKDIGELYISDLSGKALQVISGIRAGETVTANLSEYATGIYLIRYAYGKQWISGKIVLERS